VATDESEAKWDKKKFILSYKVIKDFLSLFLSLLETCLDGLFKSRILK